MKEVVGIVRFSRPRRRHHVKDAWPKVAALPLGFQIEVQAMHAERTRRIAQALAYQPAQRSHLRDAITLHHVAEQDGVHISLQQLHPQGLRKTLRFGESPLAQVLAKTCTLPGTAGRLASRTVTFAGAMGSSAALSFSRSTGCKDMGGMSKRESVLHSRIDSNYSILFARTDAAMIAWKDSVVTSPALFRDRLARTVMCGYSA